MNEGKFNSPDDILRRAKDIMSDKGKEKVDNLSQQLISVIEQNIKDSKKNKQLSIDRYEDAKVDIADIKIEKLDTDTTTQEMLINTIAATTYSDLFEYKKSSIDKEIIKTKDDFIKAIFAYLTIKLSEVYYYEEKFGDQTEQKLHDLNSELEKVDKQNIKGILGYSIVEDLDKIHEFCIDKFVRNSIFPDKKIELKEYWRIVDKIMHEIKNFVQENT